MTSKIRENLKKRLQNNEIIYVKLKEEHSPGKQVWKLASVNERGITVIVLGHQWTFEWSAVEEIY